MALPAPRILAIAVLAFGLTACTTPGSPHPTYTAPAAQPETFAAPPTTATAPTADPAPATAPHGGTPAVARGSIRQPVTVPVLVPVLVTEAPTATRQPAARHAAPREAAPTTTPPPMTTMPAPTPTWNPRMAGGVVDPDFPPTGSPAT